MTRSGIGYDLHRLSEGRKLMVGGIEVPFDKGSVGHSDGDVLSHALCDALLGAAALGDIGTMFPVKAVTADGAPHALPALTLTRGARHLIFPSGGRTLVFMRGQMHLKAKTNEGTGEIGRGEAIAAQAIATLEG